MKASAPQRPQADFTLVRLLAARRFDAAVIFTSYSQSPLPAALLCHLAGIPLRLAHCREQPYHLLTDWLADPEPATVLRHEVQRQLDLVAHVGCRAASAHLSFALSAADVASVRATLAACGLDLSRAWILVHPGATAPSRRYAAPQLAMAVRALVRSHALQVVLAGGPDDAELVDNIARLSEAPTVSVCGKLTLGELGAALKLASVAVLNNSGPAHMAAALGTPTVSLYALTNPQHTPWQARCDVLFHDVACRFCYKSTCPEGHHACLDNVAPERVVDAVIGLLGPNDSHAQPHKVHT
jgi:lipopolysaccharide heptosyltransferase II